MDVHEEAEASALRALVEKVTESALRELEALRVAVEVRCDAVTSNLSGPNAIDPMWLQEALDHFAHTASEQADAAAHTARTQALEEAEIRREFERSRFEKQIEGLRAEAAAQLEADRIQYIALSSALQEAKVQADVIRAHADAQLEAARLAQTQLLEETHAQIESAQAEVDRALSVQRGLLDEARVQHAETRRQFDETRAHLEAVRVELDDAHRARIEAREALEAAHADTERALIARQRVIDEIRSELEAARSQVEATWTQLETTRAELEATRGRLEEAQRAGIEASHAAESARARFEGAQADFAAQQASDAATRAALSEELRATRVQWESARTELRDQLDRELVAHAAALADAHSDRDAARARFADACNELDTAHARFAEACTERDAARAERDAAHAELDAAHVERDTARGDAETARREAVTARAEADEARAEAGNVRAGVQTAHAKAETASTEAETARVEADAARADAETARVEARQARIEAEAARADAEASRSDAEAARAKADVARAEAETSRAEIETARHAAREAAAAPAPTGAEIVPLLDRLAATMRTMDEAASLTQVLDALLDGVGTAFLRTSLFLVKSDRLQGWRRVGAEVGSSSAPADVPLATISPLTQAVNTSRTIVAGRDLSSDKKLGADAPWTVTLPLAVGHRVVAVVHAEDGDRRADQAPVYDRQTALTLSDLLVRHAARCLAVLTATASMGATGRADRGAEAPAPRTRVGSPLGRTAESKPGGPKGVEDARRYARLLVSEIKRYNEANLAGGRDRNVLYDRLKDDIERCRRLYAGRVPPEVRATSNFFDEALLEILAGGDAETLRRLEHAIEPGPVGPVAATLTGESRAEGPKPVPLHAE